MYFALVGALAMTMGRDQNFSPITWGILIGLGLILLVSMRSCNNQSSSTLRSRFAAAGATQEASEALGTPVLPLPAPVQTFGETAVAKLRGGDAVTPLTPVVADQKLKVDIKTLQQIDGGLQIKGIVTNISKQQLRVPLAAFRFIDQNGTVYAAQGDAAATLPPSTNTTLDLSLPIKDPTSLQMVVEIPEEQIRIEMPLLNK